MSNATPYPTDWTSKVAFMRAHGLASAKWVNGELAEAVCGPAPVPETVDERERETQPSTGHQERERLARLARRDLAARASGGPVLKLSED